MYGACRVLSIKKRLELGKIHQCGRRGPHSGNRHEFHFYAVYVQPGCRSFGTGKIVGMWMCIYNSLDWPFSRLPVIEVKTLGHGFFRDERGNDHDAFPSFNNSYVRKTSAVNLVNSFCDFRQRVFGIGTGNAPRNRFVPGALFRILNTLTVILIRIVNSGRFFVVFNGMP